MTAPRLALGTVQFGLAYGVTNQSGQVPRDEAAAILRLAAASGIDLLDTASLYGDSERVLGEILGGPDAAAPFRIVTKTVKVVGAADRAEALQLLSAGFEHSLERLATDRVHGVLLHDAGDLLGPFGPDLWERMAEWRSARRVEKIGVSVYTAADIEAVLGVCAPDLVQLPLNALDGRLRDAGLLARLAAAGVEVHARSVFLQGLLLGDAAAVPQKFGPLRRRIAAFQDAAAACGLSRQRAAMLGAMQMGPVDRIVVGAQTVAQLAEIVDAHRRVGAPADQPDFTRFAFGDDRYLNPARWADL